MSIKIYSGIEKQLKELNHILLKLLRVNEKRLTESKKSNQRYDESLKLQVAEVEKKDKEYEISRKMMAESVELQKRELEEEKKRVKSIASFSDLAKRLDPGLAQLADDVGKEIQEKKTEMEKKNEN